MDYAINSVSGSSPAISNNCSKNSNINSSATNSSCIHNSDAKGSTTITSNGSNTRSGSTVVENNQLHSNDNISRISSPKNSSHNSVNHMNFDSSLKNEEIPSSMISGNVDDQVKSENACQDDDGGDDDDDDESKNFKSSDKLINPDDNNQKCNGYICRNSSYSNFRDQTKQTSGEKEIDISQPKNVSFKENINHCDNWNDGDIVQPLLISYENENEKERKPPKSIVKSSSALSFAATPNTICKVPNNVAEPERPVLHVQFTNTTESASRTQPTCPSTPIGSIASRVSGSSSSSSSSSSEEDSQYSEAQAPDGGWGWVVVFASFMINVIADGITFSFGVLFVEFSEYFQESKSKTAWIGSFLAAIPLLSGPIASFLTDRYGCRKVTVVGSILAALGFVASSTANNMETLFLTFGILTGFGLSLCYVAAVVIVAYYFDKKRSFATGLSVCGSGIGTSIFAPFIQFLIDLYGWRGTMLVLAGVVLNMCVCGMLMKDLEWTRRRAKLKRKKRKNRTSAESFSVSNSTNTGTVGNLTAPDELNCENMSPDDPRLFSSLITLPTYLRNGEKPPLEVLELLSRNKSIHSALIQNYPNLCHSRSFSEPFNSKNNILSPGGTLVPISSNQQQIENHPKSVLRANNSWQHNNRARTPPAFLKDLRMHRHSLTYRGAMLNINRYRLRASSCPDIYRNSMTTIAIEKSTWAQGVEDFKDLLLDMLNFSYFADIRFSLFALSNFLLYTWYDIPYMYISDYAISLNFSEQDGSKLISTIGIVNMVGEIVLGYAGDLHFLNANFIYAISMGLCGFVTILVPIVGTTYWGLHTLCGCFGLFIAANYSLTSIILVELITLEKFTNAYGLLLLVQGIANLVGPPLGGLIVDLTEKYDLSFYLAGFFIIISGALLLILPALGTYKRYKAIKKTSITQSDNDEKTSNILPTPTEISSTRSSTIMGDCFRKDAYVEGVKV